LFTAGAQEFEVGPGEFADGPRGITHSFANRSAVDAECARAVMPAGIEQLFRAETWSANDAAAQLPKATKEDSARIAEVASLYGIKLRA
jgi:hypothetical protein